LLFFLVVFKSCDFLNQKFHWAQAVGLIAAVSDNVSRADLTPGSPVATVSSGGFSEYREVKSLPYTDFLVIIFATPIEL